MATRRKFILSVASLVGFVGASAAFAQHHHDDRNREYQAVINNVGRRPHQFRLKDNRDSDRRTYTVEPGQQHATRRWWHGNTSIYVDGQYVGKMRDIARLEYGTNGAVWVLDLHGVSQGHRR